MEKRGIETDRGNENREIERDNKIIELANKQIGVIREIQGVEIDGNENNGIRTGNVKVAEEGKGGRELSIRDRSNPREFGTDDQRIREKGREYFKKLRKDRELAEQREREAREFEERYKRELERRRREEERNRRYEKSSDYEMGM